MRTFLVCLCVLFPVAATAQAEFWCWDADEILAYVEGDTVRIQHLAALLNCCPEPISYEIEVGDATIFVEEHSLYVCDCNCCSNLEVTVEDVPPGQWNILYRWFDVESWEWTERVVEITVPDVGQPLQPAIVAQVYSGCLEGTNVPEERGPCASWGSVKTMFR